MRPFPVVIKALALLFLVSAAPAGAVEPEEILDDPKLEERARAISAELRCLVCQNQSIDDSDAPLAKDLRLLVRERLENGDTDAEIYDYLIDRYGEFVLLRPQFGWHTLALWAAPVAFLLLGAGLIVNLRTQQAKRKTEGLTADEEERIEALLRDLETKEPPNH